MSYIQINIGGKLRGLKFNQGAVIIMNEISAQDPNPLTTYAMIYGGLKMNAYAKRVEFIDQIETDEIDSKGNKIIKDVPITFDTVCDWVEQLEDDVLLSVMDCFKETQIYKKTLEVKEEPKEDDKKKLITGPIALELPVDG